MRKTVLMMMVTFLLIGLVGCRGKSKPKNVSEAVYNYGVAVVEVVDKYLNDEVSWEEVGKVVVPAEEVEFKTKEEIDIQSAINDVWEYILRNYETKENVLESRNILADHLNLEVKGE